MINYDIEKFCCTNCLVDNAIRSMFEIFESNECDYSSVAIICKEELAEELLRIFLVQEVNGFNFAIEYIDFDKSDYKKEYAIVFDTDGTISVDKAYFDDGEVVIFDESLICISDEVNSKLFISQVGYDDKNVISFEIVDEYDDEDEFEFNDAYEFDEDEFDCECCELCDDEDENIFTLKDIVYKLDYFRDMIATIKELDESLMNISKATKVIVK